MAATETSTPPASPPATSARPAPDSDWAELDDGEADAELTPWLRRMTIVAGLGGLLFGFDTGVISSVLVTIGTDLDGSRLTTGQEELAVSATTIGALLGALVAGKLADVVGRKKTLLGGTVFFALGAIEQSAAQVYKELVLGRGMVGLGVGLASMVLPLYFSELSPAKYRGRIVTLLVVLITFGQVVAYVVGAILANAPHGWRWMTLSGAAPALVQLILSISLPESPRYLIEKGRMESAHKVLTRVYPHLDAEAIQRKATLIDQTLQAERDATVHLRLSNVTGSPQQASGRTLADALWRDLPNRRALILACGLQFFQQATGFNTLMYYSGVRGRNCLAGSISASEQKILLSAGFSRPASAAIFIAVSNFICTLISLRLIDRVGRRKMLLRTVIGMIIGLFIVGLSFLFIHLPVAGAAEGGEPSTGSGAASYICLLAMTGFCASYGLGLGNVPWIVQSEIFSYEVRAIGGGCATAVNWVANLLIAATFLHLTQLLTATGAFWLYMLICCGAWVFAWRLLPETAGLSIEECRQLFESATPGLTRKPSARPENAGYSQVADAEPALAGEAT